MIPALPHRFPQWLDLSLIASVPHLLLLLSLPGAFYGGPSYLLPAILGFVFIPVLDVIFPQSANNQRRQDLPALLQTCLSLVPVSYTVLFFALFFVHLHQLNNLSFGELVSSFASFVLTGAVLLAAGHELIHKRQPVLKAVGEFTFNAFGYWQFPLAHVYNHHAFVATEQDNHAPKVSQSYWLYLARSYPKAVRFTYDRIMEAAKDPASGWRSGKRFFIVYLGLPLGLLTLVFFWSGLVGVCFYIGVCLLSLMMAEAVFYLQHYGLSRRPDERVTPSHTWDSYHRFTNYLIFMVPRHADHHMNWQKDFYAMQCYEEAVPLPVGYLFLIPLAFIPPLFYGVMNERVPQTHREFDLSDSGEAGQALNEPA